MDIKFDKYIATPGEKHLGIASIWYGKLLLRYKVVQGKEGGFFTQPASHKITENGEDRYVPAFMLDSRIDEEEVREALRKGIKPHLNDSKSQSTFDSDIPF